VTLEEQANHRNNNKIIKHDGKSMTMAQWAEHLGMSYQKLQCRIADGWPVELALDPTRKRRVRRRRRSCIRVAPSASSAGRRSMRTTADPGSVPSDAGRSESRLITSHATASINETRRTRAAAAKTDAPKHPLARGKHRVPDDVNPEPYTP
jgi:hypothetical protein